MNDRSPTAEALWQAIMEASDAHDPGAFVAAIDRLDLATLKAHQLAFLLGVACGMLTRQGLRGQCSAPPSASEEMR